ncbi:hypothetical protein QA641_10760 [Bradyrhizobium sp. CB1650]|uniref:hypothetical protein n=1 Tax=Bradyrhizobium sp. CB1650 TaxID=3039153 RepID=UPI002434D7D1|nr:hypothetical protein [Bradyrhizobium sp. CB1650]WGD54334.1 hypothetical protein QA641_10760 [Bradyrhizobium sp. CB1650]
MCDFEISHVRLSPVLVVAGMVMTWLGARLAADLQDDLVTDYGVGGHRIGNEFLPSHSNGDVSVEEYCGCKVVLLTQAMQRQLFLHPRQARRASCAEGRPFCHRAGKTGGRF